MIPTIIGYFSTEQSLTIFHLPALLDPIYLRKFEKETGIKIYLTYFENGPALLSKVAATKGRGYDLIIPDDHSLELLIQKGFVKQIDRSKLPFWDNLNPLLAIIIMIRIMTIQFLIIGVCMELVIMPSNLPKVYRQIHWASSF